MAPNTLIELLKLPPGDRAELAMALWASLDDASRGAELALPPEQIAELDSLSPDLLNFEVAGTSIDPGRCIHAPKLAGHSACPRFD